ncbi:MAG: MEKHLA domain-containing protein [Myxococcales bacterium]|nr:MEKHLA domain-containing protein [Myxococcales bacterium]
MIPVDDPLVLGTDPRIEALLCSYRRYLGQPLCAATELFEAPFVVLAHGLETPPLLFYGNRAALELWEMDWASFTAMPSHRTAEPDLREARARLLSEVERRGFSTGYSGVRLSSSGRRFEIRGATVWNVLGLNGKRIGQAAAFSDFMALPGAP